MQGIFEWMDTYDAEEVRFVRDRATGLKAIIAINDSTLGPSLGGVRMRPYESEHDALFDVMRLSQAMTYKCGVIGEDYGGSKAVIWGDPATQKNEAYLRSFGRFVAMMGDRFGTGVDLNLDLTDAAQIAKETDRILCHDASAASTGSSGISAALGAFEGLKVLAEEVWGSPSLSGKRVAIQGVGALGWPLAKHCHQAGAKLLIADTDNARRRQAVRELNATLIEPTDTYSVECDVFVPAAVGGVLNKDTIPQLTCKIAVLAANNALLDEAPDEQLLIDKGIAFVPDYVINAGGVLQAIGELEGWTPLLIANKCVGIGPLTRTIRSLAAAGGITPYQAARGLVEERIRIIPQVRRTHVP